MNMDFLKDFEKQISKLEGVTDSSEPPRYWHSFGNYVLNYTMSGSFTKGIPQGRVTGVVGPSGSGKSFIIGNLVKNAQDDGAIILVIDSENALDDDYMEKIGADTQSDQYIYKSVTTINHVVKIVSSFIKSYTASFGYAADAPKVLIAIDSLAMLLTEGEEDDYNKGIQKGGMGQDSKQLKKMLKTFVQDIKGKNISIVVSHHVYKNQDLTNGEGLWVPNEACKYALSQIALLTKTKLKSETAGVFKGINLKCVGYKTRFTKPYQSTTLEVPYDTGINPFSGLLDAAVLQGSVTRTGNSFYITSEGESTKRAERFLDIEWYNRLINTMTNTRDLILNTDVVEEEKQVEEPKTEGEDS